MQMSPAGRQTMGTGLIMLDDFDAQLEPLSAQLVALAKAQPGCRALEQELYGVGWLTAMAIVVELGDCRRVQRAGQAVPSPGLGHHAFQGHPPPPRGHPCRP